ncbi:MAG: hypothetical protein COA50_04000 [Flavobacteriaceae bacterium]|nr:MAG: hypothetical protein COA50_04000 [Flavobacteriaceae bacterium]
MPISGKVLQLAFYKEQMYTIMKKQNSLTGFILVLLLSQFCTAQLQTSKLENDSNLKIISKN